MADVVNVRAAVVREVCPATERSAAVAEGPIESRRAMLGYVTAAGGDQLAVLCCC